MQNTVVPISDSVARTLILGVSNAVSDHPVATALLLIALATAVSLRLLDFGSGHAEWMDEE